MDAGETVWLEKIFIVSKFDQVMVTLSIMELSNPEYINMILRSYAPMWGPMIYVLLGTMCKWYADVYGALLNSNH